jgi:hypothetical protein
VLLKGLAAAGGACAIMGGCALAGEREPQGPMPMTRAPARPVVVEMFLSQACNASPPAAEALVEIARRPDVVALSWHVGYWDQYASQKFGAWPDPFAKDAFADRQKAYNERLQGRAAMMTPQTVIDGVISIRGSKREAIERRILEAQVHDEHARALPVRLDLETRDDGVIRTQIDNVGAPYDAMVVSFRRVAVTKIEGGDNAGVVFREANVVRGVTPLIQNHDGPAEFTFRPPRKGLDCAVLVQERPHGRIVAARYCARVAEAGEE